MPFRLGTNRIGRLVVGGTPAPYPPHNPYVFYDAVNTTYSANDQAEDVVNEGSLSNLNMGAGGGTVTYTSGQYWDFDPNDYLQLDASATTSEFLSKMGGEEHTIVSLINPDDNGEEDILGNATTNGSILLMLVGGNKYRGHAWSGTLIVTDVTVGSVATGTWHVVAQRLSNSGGTGTLKVWGGEYDGTISTNTNTGTFSSFASGPALLRMGSRQTGKVFDGKMAQIAIYDSALTDTQVQEVYEWMITHQGL